MKSIVTDLNDWSWVAVEYRVWLIVAATVTGLALPLASAARRDAPRSAALAVRGGAVGLGLSSALIAVFCLFHFSDLRWLAPGQRGSVHVTAPGGIFGFAKPAFGVINSVANLPAEWQATQLAVHTAIVCVLLALAAAVLVVLTWHRARRAEIRQVVQEELRRTPVGAGR